MVQQTVCGGGGEQYSAEQICKAVGLSDSAAPPTSMQLVNTVNVTNIKSLTDAALLNLKLLYIVNRSSCAYLVPNGRDVPPVLWRYSPHSPAIWQLEDAGANSFYVRATINGYYLTATAGKIQLVFPANADSKWLISPVLGQSAAQVPLAMTFTVANVTDPTVTLTAGPAVEQTTGLSTSTAPLTTGPVPAGGDARMAEWTVQPYGPEEPFGSPPPPCPQ